MCMHSVERLPCNICNLPHSKSGSVNWGMLPKMDVVKLTMSIWIFFHETLEIPNSNFPIRNQLIFFCFLWKKCLRLWILKITHLNGKNHSALCCFTWTQIMHLLDLPEPFTVSRLASLINQEWSSSGLRFITDRLSTVRSSDSLLWQIFEVSRLRTQTSTL